MKKLPSFLLPAVIAGVATILTSGVASADNIFVANNANSSVTEYSNGVFSTFIPSNGDLNGPTGIAFDSAGDLYVANNAGFVAKFNPDGSFNSDVATGLANPRGIAFDAAGNLFVANQSSGSITEIPVGGGPAVTVVDHLLSAPNDLTFDSAGNLYVTNGGGNSIDKISFSGGAVASVDAFVTTGLTSPNGIVYDTIGANAGDFFVVDHGTSSVLEFDSNGNPVASPFIADLNAFDSPKSIAIDSAGNFYVTDTGDNTVTEYDPNGNILAVISNSDFISGSGSIKTLASVPEPGTYALLLAGLGVLFFISRRKVAVRI